MRGRGIPGALWVTGAASDPHLKEEEAFIFAVTVISEVMVDFSVSSFKQSVTRLTSVTLFVESSLFKKNYYLKVSCATANPSAC